MGRRVSIVRFLLAGTVAVLVTGCTTMVAPPAQPQPEATEAAAVEDTPTLPPGATPGLDDLNDDGEPEPTCGTHDYGAGLVLRVLCDAASYAGTPADGTELVPDSLFGIPSVELDLSQISGSAGRARDADGKQVYVVFITADTLFATGSASLSEPARANFDGIADLVAKSWPTAPLKIRGHTDATGSPAANQALSQRRAEAVVEYLAGKGIDASRLSAAGLGSSLPIVKETTADGAVNTLGQEYNRRVEVVVTVP